MEFRKNDLVTLEIEDCGIDGEGIGKADGFTVFVKDAVIGDTVTGFIAWQFLFLVIQMISSFQPVEKSHIMFILFLEFLFRHLGQFQLCFIQIFQVKPNGFCPSSNSIRGTVCSDQMRQIF